MTDRSTTDLKLVDVDAIRKLLQKHISAVVVRYDSDDHAEVAVAGIEEASNALLSLLSSPAGKPTREQVARIIDPVAWDRPGHTAGAYQSEQYLTELQRESLADADKILALYPQSPVEEELRAEVEHLKQERDEARTENEDLAEDNMKMNQMLHERNAARARAEQAEASRDEALRRVKQQIRDAMMDEIHAMLTKLTKAKP